MEFNTIYNCLISNKAKLALVGLGYVGMPIAVEFAKHISVIGFDGIKVARHIRPRLTTYRQNTEELGTLAAKSLVALIEKPKTTLIQQITVKGWLLEGDTLKKLN